jgi:hypothetical protein
MVRPFPFHFTVSWLTSPRKKQNKNISSKQNPPPQSTSQLIQLPRTTTDPPRPRQSTLLAHGNMMALLVSLNQFAPIPSPSWSSHHTHTVLEGRASLYVAYRVVIISLNSHAGDFARSSGQTWSVDKVEGFGLLAGWDLTSIHWAKDIKSVEPLWTGTNLLLRQHFYFRLHRNARYFSARNGIWSSWDLVQEWFSSWLSQRYSLFETSLQRIPSRMNDNCFASLLLFSLLCLWINVLFS